MFPGKVNSPQTELASAIDDEQTTIPLMDASVLPDPPNICTIGTSEDAETVLYTGVSGNDLTGVTRGFQGAAKAWSAGVKVARLFTAYDHDTFRQNIEEHVSATTDVHGATSAATPNTIVQRDPAGRFKAAAPSASDDVARKAEVDAHASRTDNPHGVTAAQVGLGNVPDWPGANDAEAAAGTATDRIMTPHGVKKYVDTRLQNGINFRLNGGVLQYHDGSGWKPVGGVKKVQRGSASVGGSSTTVNVTIAAVNLDKSFVVLSSYGAANTNNMARIGATLVDEMTLQLSSTNSNQDMLVNWQVVESY